MEDLAQAVVNLSNHMVSNLSNSCRPDNMNGSSSVANSGIFVGTHGLHNPKLFLQNLFGRQRSGSETESLYPSLLARITIPFAGLSLSRHGRMAIGSKSGRVADVDSADEVGGVGLKPESVVSDKDPGRMSDSMERTSNLDLFKEAPDDVSENSEVISGLAVSREELGRVTWTFLHTLAAQFPDQPTKQQQRDVKELMGILSRIYPCKECADHFKELLKANPVEAKSGEQLGQWMCRVHNVVNRSLGKAQFPCHRVDLRWGALNCHEGACDLQGRFYR